MYSETENISTPICEIFIKEYELIQEVSSGVCFRFSAQFPRHLSPDRGGGKGGNGRGREEGRGGTVASNMPICLYTYHIRPCGVIHSTACMTGQAR